MSRNNTLTHGKLQKCQTHRSDMQITAEIVQTYDLLKFAIARFVVCLRSEDLEHCSFGNTSIQYRCII